MILSILENVVHVQNKNSLHEEHRYHVVRIVCRQACILSLWGNYTVYVCFFDVSVGE